MYNLPEPCPFCGMATSSPNYLPVEVGGGPDFVAVYCLHCEAVGPEGSTEKEALEKWNERRKEPSK